MKLVLLFGDAAVGKMTVGQELMKMTKLRLFHNHMTIEPVVEVFGYYEPNVVLRLRHVFFEEFLKTDNEGLIFTFMWAFNQPEDWAYVKQITDLFESHGATTYYVELNAPLDVRLERNKTANRLQHKPTKRNLDESEARVKREFAKYRCVSQEGEIPFANYLRIDNTYLTPNEAAQRIKSHFHW